MAASKEPRHPLTRLAIRRRLLLAMGVPSTLVGLFLATSAGNIAEALDLHPRSLVIFGLALLANGAAALLLLYLRGDIRIPGMDDLVTTPSDAMQGIEEFRDQLMRLAAAFQEEVTERRSRDEAIAKVVTQLELRAGRVELPDDLREEARRLLRQELVQEATAEALSRLQATRKTDAQYETSSLQIASTLTEGVRRISRELDSLARRGNLNLVIGVITTAAAVTLLVYLVLGATSVPPTLYGLLGYYVPRISIAVFIEVFAFFFLRLYKATLFETKYYQNELTNLNLLSLAFHMALMSETKETLAQLASATAKTDKNSTPTAAAEKGGRISADEAAKLLEAFGKLAGGK